MDDKLRIALIDEWVSHAALAHTSSLLGMKPDSAAIERVLVNRFPDPTQQVRALGRTVADGLADLAIWPASGLPLQLPPGNTVGAVVRHADFGYHCVTRPGTKAVPLSRLRPGAKIVACDPVARAQLLYRYPRLMVGLEEPGTEILAEVAQGIWDAACVPAEVLAVGPRSDLEATPLPVDEVLPITGQGVVALLVAEQPAAALDRIRSIGDARLALALSVERVFLHNVSDIVGCAMAARARIVGEHLDMTGLLAGQDGEWLVLDGATAQTRVAKIVAEDIADSCRELARRERAGIFSVGELVGVSATGSPRGGAR